MSRPVARGSSCAVVRAHLKQYAARGISRAACMNVSAVKTEMIKPLVKIPGYCHINAEHFTRFLDCRYITWTGEVINTQTGQVTGTINGATVLWDALAYSTPANWVLSPSPPLPWSSCST
jgi:hypothetical protein